MMKPHAPSSAGSAFTRIELICLLAAGGLWLALALPAGADTRSAAASAICHNNHRQLVRAWLMFAQDNDGQLPGNHDGGNATTSADWCAGWLDFANAHDNTNTFNLSNGQLGRYLGGDVTVFKCPEDTSTSRGYPVALPRVRSVSMNCYMGVRVSSYTSGYWQFAKLSAITSPAPAQAFVFTDEREDSINDGVFELDMTGFSPRNPAAYILVDFPADWHEGGDTFSFADGHVEAWTWRDARTLPVHQQGQLLSLAVASPANPDVARLQAASSSKIVP